MKMMWEQGLEDEIVMMHRYGKVFLRSDCKEVRSKFAEEANEPRAVGVLDDAMPRRNLEWEELCKNDDWCRYDTAAAGGGSFGAALH